MEAARNVLVHVAHSHPERPMHRVADVSRLIAAFALCVGAGCSQQPQASDGQPTRSIGSVIAPPSADTSAPVVRDTTPDMRPRLARLEQEARALSKLEGCATAGDCRTAPMGWRGCGGPRTYLVYCAATTDTVALFRKLAELEQAERAYNASSGMMSTCEFRMPPGVRLDGRSCHERPAGP
jgi:hypothetical protein